MTQIRPRLTKLELQFLVETLRMRETLCRIKQSEMDLRLKKYNMKTAELKKRVQLEGYVPFKELSELERNGHRKRLESWKENYHKNGHIASVLAERFELLLQGKIKHSSNVTRCYLGTTRA